ncbi:hypothetical protein [Segniliparus rugosus]|uniref:DUF4352 domain-containing protein n=1 Tax=Segniliparus rugosus (strain ATCC BAA-974 / DSM 45345 / CCUG 50838 / CIP 108380 / JCM 13579 / CDC 945) TaxID=679197 RepID=E5XS77_SEGRC|nr:hypothetical protein [Segniliparus rugosus]EFV12862.1 hypothetical protein HMPREF9336_02349 [Segniliparus rugosus ATCC BAA-974]
MLERRAALRTLALSPLALLALPAGRAFADPDDDDDTGQTDGGSESQSDEEDSGEDNGHRPLGYGVTFTTQGVKVEVAALACAPVPGFITTPTGGKLWEAQIAVHVISGQSPEVFLPGTFNFRAFYGDLPFQYYYPQYSGSADSLPAMLHYVKVGDRITGKVRFMADRGTILALGFYAGSVERFAPVLFWDVPQPAPAPSAEPEN